MTVRLSLAVLPASNGGVDPNSGKSKSVMSVWIQWLSMQLHSLPVLAAL
jgi:hypothetical protein